MSMQESRQVREGHFALYRVFGTHVVEQIHHLGIDHIQRFGRHGRSLRHEILEIRKKRPHMGRHLSRRERLAHQRGIRDDRLDTRLRHEIIHQRIDRVFVLRVIDQHERIRRREDFLYLRLRFGREEDRRLAAEIPRTEEENHRSYSHRQFMPGDEKRQFIGRRHIGFLRCLIDRPSEKKHECRHRREGTDQRADHSFGQYHTHIGTYFQTHEAEHQQSYHRRQSRREDGRCCFLDSPVSRQDGCSPIGMFVLLLPVTVQQNDTIIKREHSLENRTDKIGSNRDRRQKCVRTHIEQYSQA